MFDQNLRDKTYNDLNKMVGPEISKTIELSIYNFSKDYAENSGTPEFVEQIYISKSDELLKIIGTNLKFILDSIKMKTIDPHTIAFMRNNDLNIKQYSDINRKEIEIVGSDVYECKKCKKRNSSIVEKQVRSGDEPATQFITCLECGNVYTVN
jgi:DNA-directed RNA polymerase subunit M/transcription elongation factor TFIIS